MIGVLDNSKQIYASEQCCHSDGRDCNCYPCLIRNFYPGMTAGANGDTYNCLKKLSYYVMNYGPAFASENHNYFAVSGLLENFRNSSLNVLSLGCGFCPDFIALDRYITVHNLQIDLTYTGFEIEPLWDRVRVVDSRINYSIGDVLSGFDLTGYNIVFMNKLFSTLKRNNLETEFLKILNKALNSMAGGSFLIFNDVNRDADGRDQFHRAVSRSFSTSAHYYYPVRDAYRGTFIPIKDTQNVFQIPQQMPIRTLGEVTKAIVFEYKK